ncbi:MAG: hypothetical protein Q8R57_16160 [Bacteroidota bacterium]|nr:hypothetical protein [Bacteroidota bacterium]
MKLKSCFKLVVFLLFVQIVSCNEDNKNEKKIVHKIIDNGEWFYTRGMPSKYVFYKNGIFYAMIVSYDVVTKTYIIEAIETCKPYYKNGEYLNCVGDGIVISYMGNRTEIFEMNSTESDCISSRNMSQITGWYFLKDYKNRIYEKGSYKNKMKNGIFMYFDTLGNLKQLDKYKEDILISRVLK